MEGTYPRRPEGGPADIATPGPTYARHAWAADETGAPRPHRVYLSLRVNAGVFYDLSLRAPLAVGGRQPRL